MDNVTRLLMQGAAGAGGDSIYVDDVFSTYVYKGTGSAHAINNGVDLSGEGGMVWAKNRGTGNDHNMVDTVRGRTKYIVPNMNAGEQTEAGNGSTVGRVDSFSNNGFNLGATVYDAGWNKNGDNYTTWTFRKQKGFFDVVTYTGTGSNQTVSHNLESVPGCIMVKRIDGGSEDWVVYHRGISDIWGNNPGYYYVYLNTTNGASQAQGRFNNVAATSTEFTVGTDNGTNGNGFSYIAYIFAGGESTADDARSVQLDGSGDWFTTSTSSDYTFGTGDFTVECWYNLTGSPSGQPHIVDNRTDSSYSNQFVFYIDTDYKCKLYKNGNVLETSKIARNTWNHIALVRSSGVTRLYLNGTSQGTYNDTNNYSTTSLVIGANAVNFGHNNNGRISNLRVVKGTAVYTSAFRPSTEPLKNITNTKLLCFNNSSTTGTTVGTITASGNPAAITDSPFDDPAGFQFGEGGDQNIIKCGSYKAIGGTWDLNLGWEPQWILIKNNGNQNWTLVDAIRGMAWDDVSQSTGYDQQLHPNTNSAENNRNICDAIPNGIRISSVEDIVNGNTQDYYYIAIRRPDGYVGKPVEAGTDAFAMDAGNSNSNIPCFDSGFPVDFSLAKNITASNDWYLGARLTGSRHLSPASPSPDSNMNWMKWDSNVGVDVSYNSSYQSWMWKRHAGFDVVTYKGTGTTHQIAHSLNKTVEMFWLKSRDSSANWMVWHKGLNGGTNPEQYFIRLNLTNPESQGSSFGDTAPTSTHFTVGASSNAINTNGDDCIAMLFASVDGISKVGSYTGNGSTSGPTITTGFSPRFILIKWINGYDNWFVFDTLRGISSGNDYWLYLNSNNAQSNHMDWLSVSSTGFTLTKNDNGVNGSSGNYLYYAHA
tara:strand:- start:309 stop:2927 length:2619 start_codon:yes stop_codon:yes gene_type:complete